MRPHITYLSKPLYPQSSGPVFTFFFFKNSFNLFSRISEMAVTRLALSGDHVMSPVNGVTFTSLQKAKGQVRCFVGQCVYNRRAVQYMDFESINGLSQPPPLRANHHHSLDSPVPPPPPQLATQCRAVSVPGASSTLSRTSKDIKMERERLRQERLKQWGPRRQELEVARLAEERAKFFDEARERFHNTNNELFASFLAEQEQRFLTRGGRAAAAFRGDVVPPSGSQSQLGGPETERTEAVETDGGGARIIPIAISSQPASPVSPPPPPSHPPPPAEQRKEVERVIPVLLETSSSSSSSSSTSSTPVRAPALPALMGDLRIGDSLLRWLNCKVLRNSISPFPPLLWHY